MKTLHIHPDDLPVFTDTLRFLEMRVPLHNIVLVIFDSEDHNQSVVLGPEHITADEVFKAVLHARNGMRKDRPIHLDDKGFVQPEN